jgi:hypothetical protein
MQLAHGSANMTNERASLRKPALRASPSGVAAAVYRAPTGAPPRSVAKVLQHRLGNQGTQALVARMRADSVQAKLTSSHSGDAHEQEADRVAAAVERLPDAKRELDVSPMALKLTPRPHGPMTSAGAQVQRTRDPEEGHRFEQVTRVPSVGAGRPLAASHRQWYEGAFGWDFSRVRLHAGPASAEAAKHMGAHAYTAGCDIVFGAHVGDPEAAPNRGLLAHELAHVVQQGKAAGTARPAVAEGAAPLADSLSAAPAGQVQAAPRVTAVNTSGAELGVGGPDITADAAVAAGAPSSPALVWTLNPLIAGVSVVGTGRRVRIRANQPGAGAAVGGVNFTVRAALAASAADNAVSNPVALIQVLSSAYVNAPALANVPSLIAGVAPLNTGEPNRDGIAGNIVNVNTVTRPAGRPVTITFRGGSLGAALAGNVVTPGLTTGDIRLRIEDNATRARLDETTPAATGPGATMATLVINAVPLRVSGLTTVGAAGPYGVRNRIRYAVSDNRHLPLTRVVGELITNIQDDFNLPPPNGAFNPLPQLNLAVPANLWVDQLATAPPMMANVADGLPAIDVNRFVGPGAPGLPRRLIYRQGFVYFAWQGAGAVFSTQFDTGRHRRSLIQQGAAFRFTTEHIFPRAIAPIRNEAYGGPPLIVFSAVRAVPTAAGATALAADGASTANLVVTSSVVGRSANWSVLTGDVNVTAGNPAVLPAMATLTAGARTGNFRIRAADSVFPNRRADGQVRVEAVRLRNMRAAPRRVPAGTLVANISINAQPGGRTLNWTMDAAALAAGVAVNPPSTGPGPPAANVTVTRPAGFRGTVTVTATDSVLAGQRATASVQFL